MLHFHKRSCQCDGSKGEFPGKNSASTKRVHHLGVLTEIQTFLEAIRQEYQHPLMRVPNYSLHRTLHSCP